MQELAVYPRLVQELPARAQAPRNARRSAAFALFLLLNGALFIRPAEVFLPLDKVPVYQMLIIACAALCPGEIFAQLHPARLARRPITLFVLGLLVAVALSLVLHGLFAALAEIGWTFFKVVIYYLLLMAVLDTPRRLHVFLVWLGVLTGFLALLPLLQFYGFISLPDLTPVKERVHSAATGLEASLNRLRGIGIFNDPNDLAQMLAAGVPLCFYALGDRHQRIWRWLWLAPVALSLYTIVLTRSRGGMLALEVALLVTSLALLGWKRSLIIGGLLLPLALAVYAQRRGDSEDVDTGNQRIQMWSDAMETFRQYPVFGLGADQFGAADGLVAHNSFVQAFAETGLFGGVLFFGTFYLALGGLGRLARKPRLVLDPSMQRMLPYVTGAVAGYVGGMLSLTRNYLVPPYTMAGLAASYLAMAPVAAPRLVPRLSGRLAGQVLAAATLVLLAIYGFVRLTVRWG